MSDMRYRLGAALFVIISIFFSNLFYKENGLSNTKYGKDLLI